MMTREEAIRNIERFRDGLDSLSESTLIQILDIAIEALEQTRWIPVSEALPSKGQVVLAIGEKGTWDVGKFQGTVGWTDDERIWQWKSKAAKRVEYWMPKDAFPLPSREDDNES